MNSKQILKTIIKHNGNCDEIVGCTDCPLADNTASCRRPFIEAEGYEVWELAKLKLAEELLGVRQIRATLTIDVLYYVDDHDFIKEETEARLKRTLNEAAEHLLDNGLLTGNVEASVETCSHEVSTEVV